MGLSLQKEIHLFSLLTRPHGDTFELISKRSDNSCRCAIPLTDPRPAATACRSRRGEAPEGSSLFRPGVEARSAEDPGNDIRPRQGVALHKWTDSATPWRGRNRYQCLVHGSSGLRPSTTWLWSGHPLRGASSSTLHNELNDFCTSQMRHF